MAKNIIALKRYMNVIKEYTADSAITPGMLVEFVSAGRVQAHGTAEGNAVPMYALVDDLQGKEIDEDYDADDKVRCWLPQRGEEVNVIIAGGEDVSVGDLLVSNGDGTLIEFTGVDTTTDNVHQIVMRALEAASPATDETARISAEAV